MSVLVRYTSTVQQLSAGTSRISLNGVAEFPAFDTYQLQANLPDAADPRHVVEWVNLRVTGIGPLTRPPAERRPDGDGRAVRARTEERPVCFEDWGTATIFDRTRLLPADVVRGPAVIEEFGATVPVPAGYHARVDPFGNLVVTRS